MPLESLLELVKTLSSRIDRHGPALRQSEALTRYALIDPLLRELSWDTSDPGMVMPEYRSGSGSADYALLSNGQPVIMIEAKKLGTTLGYDVISQILTYCQIQGTGFFCVTDGRLWEIYETHKPVPIDDKRIVRFDLRDDPTQVCLKALALWRYSVESGDIAAAQTPVVETTQPYQGIPDAGTQTIPTPAIQPESVIPVPENSKWQPLSDFIRDNISVRPTQIIFPDNSISNISVSKQVLLEVVDWLQKNRLLDSSHCPIKLPGAKYRYIVNNAPVDELGRNREKCEQIGQFFVEPRSALDYIARQAEYVIQHVGQDPSKFKVRLS